MNKLKAEIKAIPGETGWWRQAGQDTYICLAVRLRDYGIPKEEVVDILEKAFYAAAAEFGA